MNVKGRIYSKLSSLVSERIDSLETDLVAIQKDKNDATKSTAGDKHETSRALMQIEEDKLKVQLQNALNIQNQLTQINIELQNKKIEFGALVFTNQLNYFISVALGKIEIEEVTFYAISPVSPIAKSLLNKTIGDSVEFRGQKIEITNIV